ncbi:uncharacterized protein EAE97_001690 [Botrytis byssoidea]|uniref:Methyltransferase domain-containing protein n=1 Tax=Botrytis byssoidea TaxID=139641 RepID=A0A9P5ISC0_9HELO|nr:uncharacterized protein EAE97_001690 [Botrytis byssoidea]KAF7952193.1 hypothetical protein EAE97_001690 [Botrytis byssoidea]
MSTQYDAIGAKYDLFCDLPIQQMNHAAMMKHLGPIVHSKRILELACGTGFYTSKMLHMGASHVTAVDISSAMVSAAQAKIPVEMKDNITFCTADCAQSSMWNEVQLRGQEGTFDMVVAAWLLNYAETREMRRMLENIYLALKPGGILIALTVNAPIIDSFQPNDQLNPREAHLGSVYDVIGTVEGGYKILLSSVGLGENDIKFEFYFLREEVYRQAAAEAGMGQLEWNVVLLGEEHLQMQGPKFWQLYLDRPRSAICVSRKPKVELREQSSINISSGSELLTKTE